MEKTMDGMETEVSMERLGVLEGLEEQVVRMIEERVPRIAGDIAKMMRSGIRIKTEAAHSEAQIPVGVSKIGGRPDLPAGEEWPMWEGKAKAFIAQLNMEEVEEYDLDGVLPKNGMLYFFVETSEGIWRDDPDAWQVIHYDGDLSLLERAAHPGETGSSVDMAGEAEVDPVEGEWYGMKEGRFYPCSVRFTRVVTLPEPDFDYRDGEITWYVGKVVVSEEEVEAYERLLHDVRHLPEGHYSADNQLLGHPSVIQNPMEGECQEGLQRMLGRQGSVEGAEGSIEDWRLLLQMDSDDNAQMMWVDCGSVYFWIRQQDLAAQRFDRVWTVVQFY